MRSQTDFDVVTHLGLFLGVRCWSLLAQAKKTRKSSISRTW